MKKSLKIIPLARLRRPHGRPESGQFRWKAELFSPGGEVFSRPLTEIFLSRSLDGPYESFVVAEPPKPLGGAWGRASGVILTLRGAEPEWIREAIVGFPREALPEPATGDFYVADVLGFEVWDGTRVWGKVTGAQDVAPTLGGSVNIEVRGGPGGEMSIPSSWVSEIDREHKRLVVPDAGLWAIKGNEPSDEGSDR